MLIVCVMTEFQKASGSAVLFLHRSAHVDGSGNLSEVQSAQCVFVAEVFLAVLTR